MACTIVKNGVMKVATTIQISAEEDREIISLKRRLKLASKKAVVLEGLKNLRQTIVDRQRRERLQTASRLVRKDSLRTNREWGGLGTAVKSR